MIYDTRYMVHDTPYVEHETRKIYNTWHLVQYEDQSFNLMEWRSRVKISPIKFILHNIWYMISDTWYMYMIYLISIRVSSRYNTWYIVQYEDQSFNLKEWRPRVKISLINIIIHNIRYIAYDT